MVSGSKAALGLTKLAMLAIRVLLRKAAGSAALDRSKDFICWLRRLNSPGREGSARFAVAVNSSSNNAR